MGSSLTKEEVNRKLLHILAVILPVSIFYFPQFTALTNFTVSICSTMLFFVFLAVDLLRLKNKSFQFIFLRFFGSMMREAERKQITGATYVAGGASVCSWISLLGIVPAASAFLGLTLFILGDAVAALVGKSMGRIKIGQKTLEGSIGCFIFCFLFTWLVFPSLPGFLEAWAGPLLIYQVIFLSAAVSLLELFSIRIGQFCLNDNLYVPGAVSMLGIYIN